MSDAGGLNLDELLLPVRRRRLTRLPRLLLGAVRMVWRAAPREFFWTAVLQAVAGLDLAAQVLVVREVLANVIELSDGTGFGDVLPWLIALVVLNATTSFANLVRHEQQGLLSELVSKNATDEVLEVAAAVDLEAFEVPAFHNRLMRARTNAVARPLQLASGLLTVMSALLTMAGVGAALLIIEPLFLAILVVAYAPMWLANAAASRAQYDFSVQQSERDRRRDYLSFILTRRAEAAEVRAFDLATYFRNAYRRLHDERVAELRGVVRRRQLLGLVGGLVTQLLNGAGIAVLVWFVTTDRLELAQAGAAAAAMVLFAQRLNSLASGTSSLYESSLFIEDFTSFVDLKPLIERRRAAGTPPMAFERIAVENVSFTYPTSDRPAVEDVTMTIDRGSVVALVGENGSGKTTLAKLLAGLYSPHTGTIWWDDVDLATCDPRLVRDSVGVIFQDFVKYMLSARENIAVGRCANAADEAALVAAAQRAGAHDFIQQLDAGYDSTLGAEFFGGSDLSIGQWQRVAMARAFFRDAPLLILDEPTAALDPRSEADLFERIRELYAGRTVLLISHRFSSVRNADDIYVLQRGRIVEHGVHEELMATQGLYAELFTLQAAAYLDREATD